MADADAAARQHAEWYDKQKQEATARAQQVDRTDDGLPFAAAPLPALRRRLTPLRAAGRRVFATGCRARAGAGRSRWPQLRRSR